MEYLKRDQNHVTVQGAVTDDVNQDIEPWKVDPATGRLLVSAVVAGSENGKILVSSDDTTYEYLEQKLVAGNNITLTVLNPGGVETLEVSATDGYLVVQDDGVALPNEPIINFVDYFTVTDEPGATRTNVSINVAELEPALDLANIGGLLDLSTQVTGLLSATNIDITDLEGDLNLGDIAGQINLATQVTGQISLTNLPTLADGTIIIGDGVGSPTSLAAFSSSTGTLNVANGGTSIASYTQGDLLYASGATTISKLAKDTNATRYLSNTGTSNNPAWAQVDLTNGVTGILPIANGGTGGTSGGSNFVTLIAGEDISDSDAVAIASGTSSVAFDIQTSGATAGNNTYEAQTFLMPFDGKITSLDWQSDAGAGTDSTVAVSIYATTAGVPSGAALVTSSNTSFAGNETFPFVGCPQLYGGTTYAIVMHFIAAGSGGFLPAHSTSGSYADGSRYSSPDGIVWTIETGDDQHIDNVVYTLGEAGRVYKTDANFDGATPTDLSENFIGFATQTVSDGVNVVISTGGVNDVGTGLSVGLPVYLSNTAGQVASSAGTVSKKVGLALSDELVLIKNDNT